LRCSKCHTNEYLLKVKVLYYIEYIQNNNLFHIFASYRFERRVERAFGGIKIPASSPLKLIGKSTVENPQKAPMFTRKSGAGPLFSLVTD
jgi:hypothetical protein